MPTRTEAVSAVRRAVAAHGLIPRGATVLAAVSGGIDSCVMLDVLARLAPRMQWRLVVAHLDHGLRGAGSRADARIVEEEAAYRNLAFRGGRADVAARAKREKGGLAAVARAARYEFLLSAARAESKSNQAGARKGGRASVVRIATAHTASDQAETLLLRLLRGAGERGVAGIPVRRALGEGIVVVRPMLGLTRVDVEAHAKRFRLRWSEDPSNASPTRLRNRVRHELMPVLRALQPEAERILARAATQGAAAAAVVRRRARRALRRVTRQETIGGATGLAAGELALDRAALLRLPADLRGIVLREALATVRGRAGLTGAHVEAVAALVLEGRGRAVTAGAVAGVREGMLVLRAARIRGQRDPGG